MISGVPQALSVLHAADTDWGSDSDKEGADLGCSEGSSSNSVPPCHIGSKHSILAYILLDAFFHTSRIEGS